MTPSTRRTFLKTGAATLAGSTLAASGLRAAPRAVQLPATAPGNPLPRWRGFNLMAFFSTFSDDKQYRNRQVREEDLKWIRDWGFDYIRLPFSYWFFVDGSWKETGKMDPQDIFKHDEASLAQLDDAVEKCVKYGLHLNINMHRAPGYCINGWELEPFNLFKDPEAEAAFVHYWDLIARRYAGISSESVSFNLVNEAPSIGEKMSKEDYRRVMLAATEAIRAVSPDRIIIIDGTGVGRNVVNNMVEAGVAQAFHAYDPFRLTHYQASWANGSDTWPLPTYPYHDPDGSIVDKRLLAVQMAPWAELARQGIGVHCGECGCYNKTPHKVFLDWFSDILELLEENNIGWALWNFRGAFGVLDSGRDDVAYEDWHGHKLDRELLALLQKY